MSENKKLFNKLKNYKDIEVPYEVWRIFGSQSKSIVMSSNTASLGEDFGSIEELRKAIEFYVDQLNGKVKWYED